MSETTRPSDVYAALSGVKPVETTKVDVLAVLDCADRYASFSGHPKGSGARLEIAEARAAVAELVEAAIEVFNAPDVMFTVASEDEALADRFEAAILRCGGAK